MPEVPAAEFPAPSGQRSELTKRVLVALVGIPLVIGVLYLGDAVLATMLAVLAAIAAWEFYQLARAAGVHALSVIGIPVAAVLPIIVHGQYLDMLHFPVHAIVLLVLLVMAATIWLRGTTGRPIEASAVTIAGVAYTGATLSYVYALRYFGYAIGDIAGMMVVLLPIVLTWGNDTGAYFTGRLIGGRKLMPSVSPAKTVSGSIGGVVATIVIAYVFTRYLLRPYAQLAFSPWGLVLFAVSISVAAQIGDLVESLFKRAASVKDSGTLFPGHGGALDRLDSLFFVLPVAHVLYTELLIPAPH